MFIDVNRLSVPLLLYAVTSLQACANKKLIFGHRHAVESKKLREARLHAQLINRELVEIRNNDLTMRCTKPIDRKIANNVYISMHRIYVEKQIQS